MEKFLNNYTLIFETLDYAGLNYVLLFECLDKTFQTKFNHRNVLDNINVRMKSNYYQNASNAFLNFYSSIHHTQQMCPDFGPAVVV